MVNRICAALAITVISSFLIGLAYSIWDNTGSIAFPVMTGFVLLFAYKSAFDELFGEVNNI
ncbi:MAG: hypothetical protein ACJA1S_000574 [Cellvibrionaceae bacterium]|jgi:hypothetical protein